MTWARTSAAIPCALEGLSAFGRLLGQPQGPPRPRNSPGIHDFQPRYGWTTPGIKKILNNPHIPSNSSLLPLFIFLVFHHYVSPVHPDLCPLSFLHSLTYPHTRACPIIHPRPERHDDSPDPAASSPGTRHSRTNGDDP